MGILTFLRTILQNYFHELRIRSTVAKRTRIDIDEQIVLDTLSCGV